MSKDNMIKELGFMEEASILTYLGVLTHLISNPDFDLVAKSGGDTGSWINTYKRIIPKNKTQGIGYVMMKEDVAH